MIERQLDMASASQPTRARRWAASARSHFGIIQPTSWITAPSWGLGPKVRPADLRQVPIVTNPAPSAMFRQISGWFASTGIEPSRLDLCSSVTVCAHLVASAVAVGVLPHKMAEHRQGGPLSIVAADPPIEPGRVFVAYHEGDESKAIDAMIKACAAYSPAWATWLQDNLARSCLTGRFRRAFADPRAVTAPTASAARRRQTMPIATPQLGRRRFIVGGLAPPAGLVLPG